MNIICDLDGTIALDNNRARFLHADRCPKSKDAGNHSLECICMPDERRWTEYFAACDTDELNLGVTALLHHMKPHKIWILSGRSMSAAEKTDKWLKKHNVPYHYLQMRAQDDRTADDVLKLRWAAELGLEPKNTLFVLEDRTRVVDAWRAKGFRCFQVAPGNF